MPIIVERRTERVLDGSLVGFEPTLFIRRLKLDRATLQIAYSISGAHSMLRRSNPS
jgi:hypothetical protein